MTDSPRRDVPDPTQPLPYGNPGYTDPAYSNQAPLGSYFQPLPPTNPTRQLPPYGYDSTVTDQLVPAPSDASIRGSFDRFSTTPAALMMTAWHAAWTSFASMTVFAAVMVHGPV